MIVNRQRRIPVAVQPLVDFLERARRKLGLPESGVTVRLISDREMARLNRKFRGKRGPTDVLSFPASPHAPKLSSQNRGRVKRSRRKAAMRAGENGYLGDIAVSPETARRNAGRSSRSLPEELRILVLHGMLHLAGYDHETDEGQMQRLERRLRRSLGLS
jgi:probable rRNA maturation factor